MIKLIHRLFLGILDFVKYSIIAKTNNKVTSYLESGNFAR